MRRTALVIGLLMVPAMALALDYTKSSDQYKDAPFPTREAAAISVLTNLGAVSGNPDGTFAANRTVNRAEFLKIVFLSHPHVSVINSDADDCFPDVKKSDWFSKYVCLAERRGDVEGYPDGQFRPGNAVNYAEALKMLGELYDVIMPFSEMPASDARWQEANWFAPYREGAIRAGVSLETSLDGRMDLLLTRGQVARLAAAYRAYSEGELSLYRQFEQGIVPVRSSSSSSSSSHTSRSSSSATSSATSSSLSSSSSSSSSVTSVYSEIKSRFLLLGRTTPVLADGIFTSETEDALVRSAEVELYTNVESIDSLILVDPAGNQIVELFRRGTSDELEKQFEGSVGEAAAYKMLKGQNTRLGLKAKLKPHGAGGGSNEMFDLETWSVRLQGISSGTFYQPGMLDQHKPLHQTALGRITSVRNNVGTAISVTQGTNKLLGTFRIAAESLTGATMKIKEMNFLLETTAANVIRPRIGGIQPAEQQDCATEKITYVRITCTVIPDAFSTFKGGMVDITIYADLELQAGSTSGTVRLVPDGRGSIGSFGAVRWTDGAGTFTWIEHDVLLENGPVVTVTK